MRIYLLRFSLVFRGTALAFLLANRERKRKNVLQFPHFNCTACRLFHLDYYQFSVSDKSYAHFKMETYFSKPLLKWNILKHSHQDTFPVERWPLPPDVKEKSKNARALSGQNMLNRSLENHKMLWPKKGKSVTATHDGGFHPKISNFILWENTFTVFFLWNTTWYVLSLSVISDSLRPHGE